MALVDNASGSGALVVVEDLGSFSDYQVFEVLCTAFLPYPLCYCVVLSLGSVFLQFRLLCFVTYC
jgi:hypothetical protein